MATNTTTDSSRQSSTGSKLPLTESDGSCYLCGEHEATHVGFATLGPVGSEVGLCEDCWRLAYSDYETTIELDGTWNHKRLTASDGSVCYTYETEEGTYTVLESGGLLTDYPTRDGPYEDSHMEEAIVAGGGTVEEIPGHEIPGVMGEAVPIPEHTEKRVACPECGTIRTVTLGAMRDHNDRAHNGDRVAKPVEEFTVEDLPNMDRIPNTGDWIAEFGGEITTDGDLINTSLHDE